MKREPEDINEAGDAGMWGWLERNEVRDVLCGMCWCDGIPAAISLWIVAAVSHAHLHACTLCSRFQYLWTTFSLRLLMVYRVFSPIHVPHPRPFPQRYRRGCWIASEEG